jgi:hypothetical protein
MKAKITSIEDSGSTVALSVAFMKNDGEELYRTSITINELEFIGMSKEQVKDRIRAFAADLDLKALRKSDLMSLINDEFSI